MVIPSASAAATTTTTTETTITSSSSTNPVENTCISKNATTTTTSNTLTVTTTITTSLKSLQQKQQEAAGQQLQNALYQTQTPQSSTSITTTSTTQLQPAPRQHPKKRKFDPAELDQHNEPHYHYQQPQHAQPTNDVVPAKNSTLSSNFNAVTTTSPITLKNGSVTNNYSSILTSSATSATNNITNCSSSTNNINNNNNNNNDCRTWISTLPSTSAPVVSYAVSTSPASATSGFYASVTSVPTCAVVSSANENSALYAIRTMHPIAMSPVSLTTGQTVTTVPISPMRGVSTLEGNDKSLILTRLVDMFIIY